MTQNTIRYAEFLEESRHNKQTEALGFANLSETARHNVQTEGIGFAQVGVSRSMLDESIRHNVMTENLGFYQATANYDVGSQQAKAAQSQADTAAKRQVSDFFTQGASIDTQRDQATAAQQQADVQQQNAETRESELDLRREEVYSSNFLEAWRNLNGTIGQTDNLLKIFK